MREQIYLFIFLYSLFFNSRSAFAESFIVNDSIVGTSCITIEQKTPLLVSMEKPSGSVTKSIRFYNMLRQRIDYNVSINYTRFDPGEELMKPDEVAIAIADFFVEPLINKASNKILMSSDSTTVNTMQHENETQLSFAFGLQGETEPLSLATQFIAGPEGFNVSSVGTWFIGDYLSSGTIQVEIKAGGSSIKNAVSLSKGSLDFNIGFDEENGQMYSIPLEQNATIYPNEKFYLIITYPESVSRPQGCVMNNAVKTTPGRYWVKRNGGWADIQKAEGYSTCAWLMNVTETEAKSINWLKLTSASSGSLWGRGMSRINLLIEGEKSSPGSHTANVILSVDDTCNTRITVPVTLQINEAPHFINVPTAFSINENEQATVVIEVRDNEKDEFIVTPVEGTKIVSYTYSKSKLTLTIAPLTGDEGTYKVRFRATDTKGASRDFEFAIHVASKADNIDCLFDEKWFVYSFTEKNIEYNINDLFRYKNGENLLFQVTSRDEEIFSVTQKNDSVFSIIPNMIGESFLYFIMTNTQGKNKSTYLIPVTIGLCKDASFIVKQKWNRVLFVDNFNEEFIAEGYQWYKNNELIENETRQYYSAGDNAEDFLDFNATYHVRLVTISGDTLYTCPMVPPVQKVKLFSAYPNPVDRGSLLHINTDFEISNDKIHIQMYDFSGRLIKTGSFDGSYSEFIVPFVNKGIYIIKLSNGRDEYVQNIFIK